MSDSNVTIGDRTVRVREVGAPDGSPVVYFHGTPGSRLDLASADDLAERLGVRLVSFDRPGYGGSTPARFGLAAVAADAAAVDDALGLDRFATLGQSGGGPYALAAAAVLGSRVTRVGVASGAGPFLEVPGATDLLDEGDTAALALLPEDPEGAMHGFSAGFEPMAEMIRTNGPLEIIAGFGPMLSPHDVELLQDRRIGLSIARSMKEAVRQGVIGAGWDNVAWVGAWDVDPRKVTQPVLLWYGEEDRMADPSHGYWLCDNLPHATLTMRPGDGHLGFAEHTEEMFSALIA